MGPSRRNVPGYCAGLSCGCVTSLPPSVIGATFLPGVHIKDLVGSAKIYAPPPTVLRG